MQPHSVAVLTLANYIFNGNFSSEVHKIVGAESVITFTKKGRYRNLYYNFSNFSSMEDIYGNWHAFSCFVRRSGDPLSCYMTVKTTPGPFYEGKKFTVEHTPAHRSGFYEFFSLYKNTARGDHNNSLLYGPFEASIADSKRLTLYDVKNHVNYSSKLLSVSLEKKPEKPSPAPRVEYKKKPDPKPHTIKVEEEVSQSSAEESNQELGKPVLPISPQLIVLALIVAFAIFIIATKQLLLSWLSIL